MVKIKKKFHMPFTAKGPSVTKGISTSGTNVMPMAIGHQPVQAGNGACFLLRRIYAAVAGGWRVVVIGVQSKMIHVITCIALMRSGLTLVASSAHPAHMAG